MTQSTQAVPSKTPRVYGRFQKVKDGKWTAAEDLSNTRSSADSVLQILTDCTITGDKIKVSPETKVLSVTGKPLESRRATAQLRCSAPAVNSEDVAGPREAKDAKSPYICTRKGQQGESPQSSSQRPNDYIPSFKPNKVPCTPLHAQAQPVFEEDAYTV